MTIVLNTGEISVTDLRVFLTECNNQFIPYLDSKVDLFKYSEKLFHYANIIHTEENNKITGLIAFYANDFKLDFAFISLLCVQDGYKGKGIGAKLMNECISVVKNRGFRSIKLEVDNENQNAFSFYKKFGFRVEESKKTSQFMLKKLY